MHIPKGAEVTTTYTHGLAGTAWRRRHLRDSKYFDCDCRRCADSTEFGTNFSTLRCGSSNCDGGLVTPRDPLDAGSDWSCILCFEVTSAQDAASIVEAAEKEVEAVGQSKAECEALLERLTATQFHDGHSLAVDLKFNLIQLYGSTRCETSQMVLEATRKKELCEDILSVLSILVPGAQFNTVLKSILKSITKNITKSIMKVL